MKYTAELTMTFKVDADSEEQVRDLISKISKQISRTKQASAETADITILDTTCHSNVNQTICEECWQLADDCICRCDCCGEPVKGHPVY